ncbi:unnamed protein product [Cylicostephanus goldi]|uniref:Uncharacterized protein n=1 Tax=Cylicostephanus goldi TaxID=71465 RepID=A0A3P6R7U8_CYLGO|nr:unnamed protein product [Cylicostephanus goldi]
MLRITLYGKKNDRNNGDVSVANTVIYDLIVACDLQYVTRSLTVSYCSGLLSFLSDTSTVTQLLSTTVTTAGYQHTRQLISTQVVSDTGVIRAPKKNMGNVSSTNDEK